MQLTSPLLTEAELRQLTGATQAARQQDVLRLLRVPPGRPAPDDCRVEEEGLHTAFTI
jgi:hypothetical protein